MTTEATIKPDKAIPKPEAKVLGVERMTHRDFLSTTSKRIREPGRLSLGCSPRRLSSAGLSLEH